VADLVPILSASAREEEEIFRIENEIARRRERLSGSLGELRRRLDGVTSWRHWVRAHPLACLGLAVSLGFFLGTRGRGRGARNRH
jgi:hypothetical protein